MPVVGTLAGALDAAAGRSATGAGGVTAVAAVAVGSGVTVGALAGVSAVTVGRSGRAPGRAAGLTGLVALPSEPRSATAVAPLTAPLGVAGGADADVAGAAPPFPEPPPGDAGKAARSLRTTGASMVDDGDFTNSPSSLSLAITSLLDCPSSFAIALTRALPATALLTVRSAAVPARPLVGCAAHCGSFTACSRLVDLDSFSGDAGAGWCADIRSFRPRPVATGRETGLLRYQEGTNRCGVRLLTRPKGAPEGPTLLRVLVATEVRMKPGPPAGKPAAGVRDHRTGDHHDTEQVDVPLARTAADAGSLGTRWSSGGCIDDPAARTVRRAQSSA
jgi:hypothetical protein